VRGNPLAKKPVSVINSDNQFMSYTTSAKARILLKNKEAIVFNKDPFVIKLVDKVSIKSRGENGVKMRTKTELFNLRKYLQENLDVYVMNVSNTQISLRIKTGSNQEENVLIPKTNRPICVTKEFSSEDLSQSADFRKIMNRRPPVLVLLTEEEYLKWHDDRAEKMGTSFDEEIFNSSEYDSMLTNPHRTLEEAQLPKTLEERIAEENMAVTESVEVITPRVMGLMAEVASNVPKDDKMKCEDIMSELEAMESELTREDYQKIASEGFYKRVRNWASKHLDEMESE
jgi:hypothetical protein